MIRTNFYELNGNRYIILDEIARILHNFNPETGGVEHPHILNPFSHQFREKIHKDAFVCNNFIGALQKYRSAGDRCMHKALW